MSLEQYSNLLRKGIQKLDEARGIYNVTVTQPITVAENQPVVEKKRKKSKFLKKLIPGLLFMAGLMAPPTIWTGLNIYEMSTGIQPIPTDNYADCEESPRAEKKLPEVVTVGLYFEFPNEKNIEKLKYINFPVTVAVAAPSVEEFNKLKKEIEKYPYVREVIFWPVLKREEGYYPGSLSDHDAVKRVTQQAAGQKIVLDSESPPGGPPVSPKTVLNVWRNKHYLEQLLRERNQPVHLWRSHNTMGLDPLFLRLIGMHFDPKEYPQVYLHLDLYAKGKGLPKERMRRILQCGVDRWGKRFIPALGVLNDGNAPPEVFVEMETLRRDLHLAREAGVWEIWLFEVNGLNDEVVKAIREALPVDGHYRNAQHHRAAAPGR